MKTGGRPRTPGIWLDTHERYGLVSRILHWAMAAAIGWQFAPIVCEPVFGQTALTNVMRRTLHHDLLGLGIFVLAVCRAAWALVSRKRRPSRTPGLAGICARCVHFALYTLMIAAPGIALLRLYGFGGGWHEGDLWLMPASGHRRAWMIALGDAAHHWLGYALLMLVLGHIAVALVHGLWLRDGIVSRMAGGFRRRSPSPSLQSSTKEQSDVS